MCPVSLAEGLVDSCDTRHLLLFGKPVRWRQAGALKHKWRTARRRGGMTGTAVVPAESRSVPDFHPAPPDAISRRVEAFL